MTKRQRCERGKTRGPSSGFAQEATAVPGWVQAVPGARRAALRRLPLDTPLWHLFAMRPDRTWRTALGAAGGSLVLAVAVHLLGIAQGWWLPNHPDPARFPLWGIDVSHHQERIDWPVVAREPHIAFAYLKATEGGDWTDPRFAENWREARHVGLKVGAYHFFTFCRPGSDQARHFLSVAPHERDTLPPAVDVEFGGNCSARPDRESLRRELDVFLDAVESGLGRTPVIYLTRETYDGYFAGNPGKHPIWIRNVWLPPGQEDWTFWQFANRARIPGIETAVDLNVFRHADRIKLDAL